MKIEPSIIYNSNPRFKKYRELMEENPNEARAFQNSLATSQIIINFSSNWPSNNLARDAFRFAADMWEMEVVSSVPIVIDADYRPMGQGVIGSNSSRIVTNVPNAPDPSMSYVASLGNSIAGIDLLPGQSDMVQSYNTEFAFYFGLDARPPNNQMDFVTIAFHEIGHGMGITGASNGGLGVGREQGGRPYPWDTFVETVGGTNLLNMVFNSPEQVAALRSNNLFINSFNTKKVLNGTRPKIFAPASFSPGSSFSHWDELTFPAGDPNSLMTPQVGFGEAIHDLGDLTRGILRDMGWQLAKRDPFDLGLEKIISPINGIGLGSETITASIGNLGLNSVSNIPIAFKIDDGPWVEEVFTGMIEPGGFGEYTFTTLGDFSEPGRTYSLSVRVNLFIDGVVENNVAQKDVTHLISETDFPYLESFEDGPGGWVVEGDMVWKLGTPDGTIIIGASDGNQAWATNLTGNYPSNATSFVVSPSFDFSGLVDPEIELDIWYEIETGWDGVSLQMSVDNGNTWSTVGKFGDADNWYNDGPDKQAQPGQGAPGIDALIAAIGDGNGWTGDYDNGSGGYLTAKRIIEGAGNQSNVILRMVFASDEAVNNEGFAFDNIRISAEQLLDKDAGIVRLLSPENGNLSSEEDVTIEIRNFGTEEVADFNLGYILNNGPTVIESFVNAIASGNTATYTFEQVLDLSSPGDYELKVFLAIDGDQNLNNDTLSVEIQSIQTISDFPYHETFESGPGGWVSGGEDSSWELGSPINTIINSASVGSQAWVTGLDANYNASENSFLQSPAFDFTTVQEPVLVFDIWYETELLADGASFQYSIDNGKTWQQLDNSLLQINWNPEPNVTSLSQPGWSGSSNGFQTAYIQLDPLQGKDLVFLRLLFGSNGLVENEGIALDNVRIFDRTNIQFSIQCPAPIQGENDPGLTTGFVNLVNPIVTGNDGLNTNITNDFTHQDDASASYPIGTTQVTFLVDVEGVLLFCQTSVVISDTEAPVIDCPDEIVIAVLPGVNSTVVEYDIPLASDNLGFEKTFTYSLDQSILQNAGIACGQGPNRFLRPFRLAEDFNHTGDFLIGNVDIGVESSSAAGGNLPGTINIYSFDDGQDLIYSNFELISSTQIQIPGGLNRTIQNFEVSGVIPNGKVAVLELQIFAGGNNENPDFFFPGANSNQFGTSFIVAPSCGISQPVNVLDAGFPNAQWVMNLNGLSTEGQPAIFQSGIGSGNAFPLGSSTEFFQIDDLAGNIAFCEFDVNVVTATLDPPVGLDSENVTQTGFTVNWEPVPNVDGYEIFVFESGANSPLADFNGIFTSETSFNITGLNGNTVYEIKVRSKNQSPQAYSIFSNPIILSTLIETPEILEISSVTSTSFEVNWTSVSNIENYELQLSLDNFSTLIENFFQFQVTPSRRIVSGLLPNALYFLRVRAVNEASESDFSPIVAQSTLPSTPKAFPPSDVNVSGFTANWEVVDHAMEYEIDVSTNNFVSNLTQFDGLRVSQNFAEITGLNSNLDYQYRVRTVNENNLSSIYSNQIRTTTLSEIPHALPPSQVNSYGAVINWRSAPNVLSYEVDFSDDNFETNVSGLDNLSVNDTSFLLHNLIPETTYSYRVRSINRKGIIGQNSNVIEFTTLSNDDSGLVAPIAFAAEEIKASNFLASWSTVNSAIFYEFNFGLNISQEFSTTTVFVNEKLVEGLEDDTDYQYRVRAFNNIGFSDYSNVINLRTILGLLDELHSGLQVYPVPTFSNVNIELNNDWIGLVDLVITDNLGRVVYQSLTQKSGGSLQMNIDVSDLSKGLYYIRVHSGEKYITRRIIKN